MADETWILVLQEEVVWYSGPNSYNFPDRSDVEEQMDRTRRHLSAGFLLSMMMTCPHAFQITKSDMSSGTYNKLEAFLGKLDDSTRVE